MKLSKWAAKQGISYLTAYRWFKSNKIPNAYKTLTGAIMVNEPRHKVLVVVGNSDVIEGLYDQLKGNGLNMYIGDV
jgi:predicted site-specific integrase-resolvase